MNKAEMDKLQTYLRRKFANPSIRLQARGRITDSCEVLIGDEYVGNVSRIEDEGEVSWNFDMSILEMDLATV